MFAFTVSKTDAALNAALTDIEVELRPALIAAVNRVNTLLACEPLDIGVVHRFAADLHSTLSQIAENAERRARPLPDHL